MHRYWSVVESHRGVNGKPARRHVMYLVEINDSQQSAWRKRIEVSDEGSDRPEPMSLFPSDRPIPADEVNALSLRVTDLRLKHVRSFGDCWLGCQMT